MRYPAAKTRINPMNTFNPYVVGTSCILKGGDTADRRMTELNELIATAKARGRAHRVERLPSPENRPRFLGEHPKPPSMIT